MPAQLTLAQAGLLIVFSMAIWEIIRLSINHFFKKTIDTEYVTVSRCRQCREACDKGRNKNDDNLTEGIKKLGESIDVLRSIVLVLSVKVGVDESTLKDLAGKKAG